MSIQNPRIPISCPHGFLGRYTVIPGDTMYRIAQMFRTRLEALAVNNTHIQNPNLLLPGDILCVPSMVAIPCTITLRSIVPLPFGSGGVAFANFAPQGGQAVSVLATLPLATTFGNYDIYIATVFIKEIGGFGNQLFSTPQNPPTWSTRIDLPTVASLSPDTQVVIQPSNSITGISGPQILIGTLINCDVCSV